MRLYKGLYVQILQHDSSSALVLILHELLSVFAFFVRRLLEVLEEALQRYVIAVEIVRLKVDQEVFT